MYEIMQPPHLEGEGADKDAGGAEDIPLLRGERVCGGRARGIRHAIRKADRKQPVFSPKELYATSGKYRKGKIPG